MRITVENVRGRTAPLNADEVYVGRPNARLGIEGSVLANPFVVRREAEREPAILRYREWLVAKIAARDSAVTAELDRLRRQAETKPHLRLLCWCSPRACHASVIAEFIAVPPASQGPTP